jgi:hypothetical protein
MLNLYGTIHWNHGEATFVEDVGVQGGFSNFCIRVLLNKYINF